jgi:hypothetical protein
MYVVEYENIEVQMNVPIPEQELEAITTKEKMTLGWFQNWEVAKVYIRKFYEREDCPFEIEYISESISITKNKKGPSIACQGEVVLRYEDDRNGKKVMVTERLTVRDFEELTGHNPFDDIMAALQ